MNSRLLKLAAVAALIPSLAFAHTGAGDAGGVAHGFSHPFSGLDHVVAMVMVGVFAWQLGGRSLWLVPSAFVLMMAAGGVLGAFGLGLPFVETGIALSVFVLGVAVAFGIRPTVAVAMGVVGAFAIFHGYAHGAEMPGSASGLAYGLAFMVATAMLHGAGIAAGRFAGQEFGRHAALAMRSAGGVAAIAGVGLLTGLI